MHKVLRIKYAQPNVSNFSNEVSGLVFIVEDKNIAVIVH